MAAVAYDSAYESYALISATSMGTLLSAPPLSIYQDFVSCNYHSSLTKLMTHKQQPTLTVLLMFPSDLTSKSGDTRPQFVGENTIDNR